MKSRQHDLGTGKISPFGKGLSSKTMAGNLYCIVGIVRYKTKKSCKAVFMRHVSEMGIQSFPQFLVISQQGPKSVRLAVGTKDFGMCGT